MYIRGLISRIFAELAESVLIVARAYFDGFQIVVVSFIAEFFFRLCYFVFDVKQLLKVKFVVYYVLTKMGDNE